MAHAIVHAANHHGTTTAPFPPLLQAATAGSPAGDLADSPTVRACRDLEATLEATRGDFEGRNRLFRTLALRAFERMAGHSLNAWIAQAAALTRQLQHADSTQAQAAALLTAKGDLERLAGYYRDTAANVHHYIRDPDLAAQARQTMQQREAVVDRLLATAPAEDRP